MQRRTRGPFPFWKGSEQSQAGGPGPDSPGSSPGGGMPAYSGASHSEARLTLSFPQSSRATVSWVWWFQPASRTSVGTFPDFPAEPEHRAQRSICVGKQTSWEGKLSLTAPPMCSEVLPGSPGAERKVPGAPTAVTTGWLFAPDHPGVEVSRCVENRGGQASRHESPGWMGGESAGPPYIPVTLNLFPNEATFTGTGG